MIVVVGGMIRSGSTFSFNITRELLQISSPVDIAACNSIDQSIFFRKDPRHYVLKSHGPDQDLLIKIQNSELPCICTIRRPEEAVASWMQTFRFSFEHGLQAVASWLEWYAQVASEVLTIDFTNIETDPHNVVTNIASYLNLAPEPEIKKSLCEKYSKGRLYSKYKDFQNDEDAVDIGFSYYDRETFFHRRHISSPTSEMASRSLSRSQLDAVFAAVEQYMDMPTVANLYGRPEKPHCPPPR